MPSNPLEKQFALLGTASTAGLLDVQKAYRSGFFAIFREGVEKKTRKKRSGVIHKLRNHFWGSW